MKINLSVLEALLIISLGFSLGVLSCSKIEKVVNYETKTDVSETIP